MEERPCRNSPDRLPRRSSSSTSTCARGHRRGLTGRSFVFCSQPEHRHIGIRKQINNNITYHKQSHFSLNPGAGPRGGLTVKVRKHPTPNPNIGSIGSPNQVGQTVAISMALPTTEQPAWHCGDHSARLELLYQNLLLSVARDPSVPVLHRVQIL